MFTCVRWQVTTPCGRRNSVALRCVSAVKSFARLSCFFEPFTYHIKRMKESCGVECSRRLMKAFYRSMLRYTNDYFVPVHRSIYATVSFELTPSPSGRPHLAPSPEDMLHNHNTFKMSASSADMCGCLTVFVQLPR